MLSSDKKPLLVLLDGHGIIHRAYHALKEPLVVRKTGEVVSAVFGLANTILNVLDQLQPTHIAVALDPKGPTFRHEMDETYKAHRPEAPEDLRAQIDRCVDLLDAFSIPIYQVTGFEADDVLGTLAREAAEQGIDTFIVSLDSDMVQLVEPRVRVFMFRPYLRDTVTYDEAAARERYGFDPPQMADFKGLKGDASDNIPGVPGIGDKTAVKLIEQFGSLENVYAHLDEVEPEKLRELLRSHEEQARHSKDMATIRTDVPVALDLAAAEVGRFERRKVLDIFRELEFRSRRRPPTAPSQMKMPCAPWRSAWPLPDSSPSTRRRARSPPCALSSSASPYRRPSARPTTSPWATRPSWEGSSNCPWRPCSPCSAPCSRTPPSPKSPTTASSTC